VLLARVDPPGDLLEGAAHRRDTYADAEHVDARRG
jgi:hypothetical protein